LAPLGSGSDAGTPGLEHDRTSGRVLFTVLFIVILVGIGASGSKKARSRLRELAELRETIDAGGIGIPLRVVTQSSELRDGRVIATRYTLELPEGTRVERRCVASRPPFMLQAAPDHALALRHPQRPELVALLDRDLHSLELDAGEADRVRKRHRDQRDAARGA
jgi:hypothetical protein